MRNTPESRKEINDFKQYYFANFCRFLQLATAKRKTQKN
jgi:hypothetical protein